MNPKNWDYDFGYHVKSHSDAISSYTTHTKLSKLRNYS